MSVEFRNEEEAKDYANYTLGVDDDAQKRLVLQSGITREMMGVVLPPAVIAHLKAISEKGERPRIADVGTGPGNWLFDARAQLREAGISAILDGYDLYPSLFPSEEKQKAEDIKFSELNIHTREQFESIGKYDVMHIRYLSAGIGPEQWDAAFDNCLSVIKPGGIFVWEELLLEKMSINDPATWKNVLRMFKLNWSILRRNDVDPKLSALFGEHLEATTREEFTTKNLPEKWQRMQAVNMSMATKELVEGASKHGDAVVKHLGLENVEELQALLKLTQQDFRDGCILHMPVNRWMGVKPLAGENPGRPVDDTYNPDSGKAKRSWVESIRRLLC
ncbi:hypothetical protein H072_645 [Dactylellina haptotyla CBS 200.50]|uniref:Methyltransferase domain-containing protein n=1 Tax=Dactylellina haptotyla (strain CBS 200.50) TaxID=1284197 RepID=S8AWM8_DACHA|nr:hypothetical protein H072_645 [Dactylellina haptotyla CBS 200.50]